MDSISTGQLSIREVQEEDLQALLRLYTGLHGEDADAGDECTQEVWRQILKDRRQHILVGCLENEIVSSCVLIVVPNLTHGQRPYALIENVVTEEKYRGKGYASAVMNRARETAKKYNCYKIMLLTGSKKETTLNFYERLGYNRRDKTAFIQWI